MRTKLFAIGGIVLGVALAGCSSQPASTSNSSSTSSSATTQGTNVVTIQGMAFSPQSITITAGTTVTWTNNDGVTHTVAGVSAPSGFGSGDLANGQSYSFTFTTPGTYTYHCSIHPSMTGTVVVQ